MRFLSLALRAQGVHRFGQGAPPHPAARGPSRIEACQDHVVLCDWILKAADLDTVAFSALLGLETR